MSSEYDQFLKEAGPKKPDITDNFSQYDQYLEDPSTDTDAYVKAKSPETIKNEETAKKERDIGAFNSGVVGFNRTIERGVEGILQLGAKTLGMSGDSVKQVHQQKEAVQSEAFRQHPVANVAGQVAGYVGQGLAIPGGTAGALSTRMVTGAISGAALSGAQYVEEGGSRIINTLLGGMIGGSIPLISNLVGRGLGMLGKPAKKVAEFADNADLERVKPIQQAAEELGVTVSPGESIRKVVASDEARIPMTPEKLTKLSKALTERDKILGSKLNDTISSIVSEGDDVALTKAQSLYNNIDKLTISDDAMKSLMSNKSITNRLTSIDNSGDSLLSGLSNNSVSKLRAVKENIDKELITSKNAYIVQTSKSLTNDETKALKAARSQLVDVLNQTTNGDYKVAREIMNRIKTKQSMTNEINKIQPPPGFDKQTPDQIYKALFSNPAKKQTFIAKVEAGGGDVQQAKNLVTVLHTLQDSPLDKLVGRSPILKSEAMGGTMSARLTEVGINFLKGQYNENLFELALNPKWLKEVEKLKEAKGPKLINGLGMLLQKAAKGGGPQTAVKELGPTAQGIYDNTIGQ